MCVKNERGGGGGGDDIRVYGVCGESAGGRGGTISGCVWWSLTPCVRCVWRESGGGGSERAGWWGYRGVSGGA